MRPDQIKKQFELIRRIERLKEYLSKPILYDYNFAGNRGSIPYNGNTAGLLKDIPDILKDMEAVARRAIERELANTVKEAEQNGIQMD